MKETGQQHRKITRTSTMAPKSINHHDDDQVHDDREEEPGEAAGARHEGGEWRTSGRRVCLFAARRMLA